MASEHGGGYEAELDRIRGLSDSIIPKTGALLKALTSLDRALANVDFSDSWRGSAAERATAEIDEIRSKLGKIHETIRAINSAVIDGNQARRETASQELPSTWIDPFWAKTAKGASFVIHPVLGPLAADRALDAIGDFLGNQREEAARKIVQNVENSLVDSIDGQES